MLANALEGTKSGWMSGLDVWAGCLVWMSGLDVRAGYLVVWWAA